MSDPYTKRKQDVFELSDKAYKKRRKEIIKAYEQSFEKLIKNKQMDELEALRDDLEYTYQSLDRVSEAIGKIDVRKLPLQLDFRKKTIRKPKLQTYPEIIHRSDAKYNQSMSFFTKLWMSKIKKHYEQMQTLYLEDVSKWLEEYDDVKKSNEQAIEKYLLEKETYEKELKDYKEKKAEKEAALKRWHHRLVEKEPESLSVFLSYAMSQIGLPLKQFDDELRCSVKDRVLRVEASLPYVEDLVAIKNVRYIQSKDEIRITEYSQAEMNKIYHAFVMKYIALISAVIRQNLHYFDFDVFIINGKIRGRQRLKQVVTISSQTSSKDLFNVKSDESIVKWLERTEALVGKKLSNRTALKKVY